MKTKISKPKDFVFIDKKEEKFRIEMVKININEQNLI